MYDDDIGKKDFGIERELLKKNPKPEGIRIARASGYCPNCDSTQIRPNGMDILGRTFTCLNCNERFIVESSTPHYDRQPDWAFVNTLRR